MVILSPSEGQRCIEQARDGSSIVWEIYKTLEKRIVKQRTIRNCTRFYMGVCKLMATDKLRADRQGQHRTQFDRNKKKVLASQDTCAICGKPVDKSLRWPHPMCATIDHIIPVNRGGHPSSIDNLQLAHWTCNRQKSDNVLNQQKSAKAKPKVVSNRLLPLSMDWTAYEK